MKKMLYTAAVAAATLLATPALAQGAAPAEAGGGRVELLIGYDKVRVDLADLGIDDHFSDEGVVFGIGGGYDFAVGSGGTLVGLDVEATESTMKESEDGAEVKAGRDFYAGGRVTFPVGNAANLYVKGGYTNFLVKGEIDGTSESSNLDGWRLGVGGQFAIRGATYVGGEYRYSNYEADVSRHQFVAILGWRF